MLTKSHIIPGFMYSPLYSEGHRMAKFRPKDMVQGNGRLLKPHDGEYEANILCHECDNVRLGRLESYAKRLIEEDLTTVISDRFTHEGLLATTFANVNYNLFKLFLLSVLWRAGISGREFFKDVNLGPYEEKLRKLLIEEDAGREDEFPILLMTWLSDSTVRNDIIVQPARGECDRGMKYLFPIAGFIYVFYDSLATIDEEFRPYVLSEAGQVTFLHFPEGQFAKIYRKYFRL